MRKTKRPVHLDLAELWDTLLHRYVSLYPADQLEANRDSKRLALELRSRGPAFFTLDLPAMGKVLDTSLSRRRLADCNLPGFGRKWKASPIPRLFSGLWIRLFERSGMLREDVDPDCIALLRALLYAGKKINLDCKPTRLYETTKEYYDVDTNSVPPPSRLWLDDECQLSRAVLANLVDAFGSEINGPGCERPGELCSASDSRRFKVDPVQAVSGVLGLDGALAHIQRCAERIGASLGYFDPGELQGKHGPGAVSEQLHGKNKYLFPTWSARLEEHFPWDYHGVTTVDNFLEGSLPIPHLTPKFEESASKLIDVPKTQKAPRLIASEPVANQWAQQAVATELRIRTKSTVLRHSIEFFDQNPSREDARSASRHGRRATIDLSSASDRLSCTLVEAIFASNISLLKLLIATRTRFIRNSIDKKMPSLHRLNKFASMGSALTFPVQSIVFAILAIGVGSYLSPRSDLASIARKVRVFGDDIIVPVDWVPLLRAVFTRVGLKINESKTFSEGNFRESCGMDAWMGYDVTPPYLRWPSSELYHRSAVGYVAVSNNFFSKGYWKTAQYLDEAASWVRKLPAVGAKAVALGRLTFCKGLDPTLKIEWDPDTQQEVARVYAVKSRQKPKLHLEDNPNGMMEYSVGARFNDYSWRNLFHANDGYLPLSSWLELPPDGSGAVIRARRVPTRLLV